MTLARWFLPLLWSTIRFYTGSLQVWSSSQYLRCGQLLAVRRDFSPSHSRPSVACPILPDGRILILALVGRLFAVLALGPQNAASSVTGEVISPLPTIALGSGASPVLRLAEARPLTTRAPLACPPEAIFTTDDSNVDNDDSMANPLLTLRAHVFPLALDCRRWNGSTHTNSWPFRLLTRSQLLKRLYPLPLGGVFPGPPIEVPLTVSRHVIPRRTRRWLVSLNAGTPKVSKGGSNSQGDDGEGQGIARREFNRQRRMWMTVTLMHGMPLAV
jgi:hypothetical protein